MTFCRSLPNMPKNSVRFSGNRLRSTPSAFNLSSKLHVVVLADLAIRVADDGDFAPALDRARQRQRAHGAAQRAGDDVARVAQPDELLGGQRQRVRKKSVQPRVNARQRDDRQRVRKIRRMQTRRSASPATAR